MFKLFGNNIELFGNNIEQIYLSISHANKEVIIFDRIIKEAIPRKGTKEATPKKNTNQLRKTSLP